MTRRESRRGGSRRRDGSRETSRGPQLEKGVGASQEKGLRVLTSQQVHKLIDQVDFRKFLDSDNAANLDLELTRIWVLKASEHYFEADKAKGSRVPRQRPHQYRSSRGGRGGYGGRQYSGHSHQNERWYHRDQIRSALLPNVRLRFAHGGHEESTVEKLINKSKRALNWEYEKDASNLQWPGLYDPIALERNVLPFKKVSGVSITFSAAQANKIVSLSSRKSSLQAHSRGRKPEDILKDWNQVGVELREQTIEHLPEVHKRYQSLWHPFVSSLDEFSSRNAVDVEVKSLTDALEKLRKSLEAEEKELQDACKTPESLAETAPALIDKIYTTFVSFVKNDLGNTLVSGVKTESERLESLVNDTWEKTYDWFMEKHSTLKYNSKIIGPPKMPPKPSDSLSAKVEALCTDLQSQVQKVKSKLTSTSISENTNANGSQDVFAAVVKPCMPGSLVDLINGCVTQVSTSVDVYASSQLKALAMAVQKLSDVQARGFETDLLSGKWYALLSKGTECRLEYSWSLRFGASLLIHAIGDSFAASSAKSSPAPTVKANGFAKNSVKMNGVVDNKSSNGVKDKREEKPFAKQQGQVSTITATGSSATASGTRNVPPLAPGPKPATKVPATRAQPQPGISYSQITKQADTISSISKSYEKKLQDLAQSKDLEIKRLKEENGAFKAKMEAENEAVRLELENSLKEVEYLQKVLQDAEQEIEAQRHIQIQLSQVVKSLQRDARTVQHNPATMGYYQQHTAPVMMMHPGTSQVVGYPGHPAYHLQAQQAQMYSTNPPSVGASGEQVSAGFHGAGNGSGNSNANSNANSYSSENSKG